MYYPSYDTQKLQSSALASKL